MPDSMSETQEMPDAGAELFVAPASFAQWRLWLLDRVHPGSTAYNVPLGLRVHGPLNLTALADTLAGLVARHETLRTAFDEEEGEPVQVINPVTSLELQPELPVIDLRREPDPEAAARRLSAEDAARPFDLRRAPLFRVQLLRLADEEHLLVINLHHIITDGWSLGILVRELSVLYTAFCAGQPSPLPDLPIQYADFADWQRQWLQGEVLEQKVRPWRQRLAGAPADLGLPTDRPRSTGPSEGRCGFVPLALGAPLSATLRQTARGAGATVYMTLLAGFQVLLYRHSGLVDVVVGSPVANRNRTEVEGLIGVFVNLLAQRGDLSGDPSFEQFLERVRTVTVEALANEDLPFEKLVEELRPDRRLQHSPLFSALFALQQPQPAPATGAGLRWELAEVHPATAKYELSLQLSDEPAEIRGFWDYDADIFDASTIARLGRHLATLLADAVAHPQRRIAELALLEASEWHQIAAEWNDAASVYPRQETVYGLIAARAERTPDAPALLSGEAADQAVTYGELLRRARLLARHLRALGVRRESLVGIFLERGPEMIVAWLGTLIAGGAYLPLDPSYPAERIAFMLQDAGVACVVSRGELIESLPPGASSGVPLLDLENLTEPADLSDLPASKTGPDNLAYVVYTSGSTGNPKGVAVSHRSILRLVCNTNFLGYDPADRMAQLASVSFDLAVFETWGALINGAPLVLFDRETAVSPEALFRALQERRIGITFLTSTLFHRMASLDAAGFRGIPNLLVGGETVDPSRAAEVLAAGPPVRLVNAYGPTECTVFAVCQAVREVPPGAATVPIGRPIANTTAIVLDAGLQPAPAGVTGELYLGGDGLARGYLGRPELTAERFVPAPCALGGTVDPGARLYRTGDLARLRADGSIDCLGRADNQVKIRGVRIEPGEVEAVLAAHPGVAECAVAARRGVSNRSGELALTAWIVSRRQPAPTAQELREHLQSKLPDSMLPAAFVQVAELPRTPNGKLDRAALPDPGAASADGPGFVPPRTPVEEVLAGIFASVLRRDQLGRPGQTDAAERANSIGLIGAFDNFFDLGGHSLTATAVTSLVRSTFQVELPTRAIFKEPTLEALAQQIETLLLAREGLELPAITPVPRGADLPLSFAQQRLWFLDELAGGETPFHNISAALRLRGRLDAAALAGAFDEIVRRHEALRTTFRTGPAGTPVQTIHPHQPFPLPLADLTGLPPELREPEARRLGILSAAHPFALTRGPLLRATLLRLGAGIQGGNQGEQHAVLLAMHHIVSDGWSLEVFVRELGTLYRAFSAGQPSPLPPLPVQYADFAAWQRRWLAGPALKTQLGFWRQQLADLPLVLDLATDRPRPALQSYTGEILPISFPASLADNLRTLARQHRATLFMALLTAFSVLLRRYTGHRDILVGSPIANRNRSETSGLIGFFVNLLALRADLSGNPGYGEALDRVREMALGAYAHQDLPFERLVEDLERARDLSRHPLFQVSFATTTTPWHAFDIPGLDLSFFDVATPYELYDITLQTFETSQGLRALFSYNTDLFDAATVARMGQHLEILLGALTHDPSRPVDAIALLREEERRQLLENRPAEAPSLPLVTELFAQQAARQPAAPALLWEGGELSYEELDRRANRLARHLGSLGAGLETPVALCLDRAADFAVALLAVWKAGAAALPLDAEAPAERLRRLLADSGARVLVTRSGLHDLAAPSDLSGLSIVRLDADRAALARCSTDAVASAALPANAAYILYTSGSTGAPKGVLVPHEALASHCREMARRLELGPDDRVLQTAAFVFDVVLEEMVTAWISGAAVVPWDAGRGAAELSRVLTREKITVANLPTPLWHQAVREWAAGRVQIDAPHLRWMIIGSETPPTGSLALWRQTPLARQAQLANAYGTTETTITATFHTVDPEGGADLFRLAIGRPLADRSAILLDVLSALGEPVPAGVPGEICIGGPALARGYPGRPDLTAAAFVPDPWSPLPGARLYRTGDLARRRGAEGSLEGVLEYLGRRDQQLKLRGYRIEPAEVEAALLQHPGVQAAAVGIVEGDGTPETRALTAWIVPAGSGALGLREHLRGKLPAWMVPSALVEIPALPLTPGGKIDRARLTHHVARYAVAESPGSASPAPDSLEALVTDLWREALGLEAQATVRTDDNFFDLGGHSMLLSWVRAKLQEKLGTDLSMIDMFNAPTVRSLAASLRRGLGAPHPQPLSHTPTPRPGEGSPANFPLSRGLGGRVGEGAGGEGSIAIIGMAGRFPGARDVDALWSNLRDGVESITFFAPEGQAWKPPGGSVFHVPARGVMEGGADGWDAEFFGYSAREAEMTDPQHRLFLETAWQALEKAGYAAGQGSGGPVGVFGGASRSDYQALLVASGALSDLAGSQLAGLGTEIDFLTTRVSYKLNLEGPSFDVQAACATSLVAVHLACQSLLAGECTLALAGGVAVTGQPESGYVYQEGGQFSPDGHCRSFDARGQGSVDADGVAIVVLKRLADALADGDHVHAVIKATGVNNDGADKVGFLAPRQASQSKLIRSTLDRAGVPAGTIGLVEAHGTATPHGDPIEVGALTEAFRADTARTGFCALGSIKTNLGYLHGAAGLAGLIKAVLALENRTIPPSLHFEQPNPALHLDASPFFVPQQAIPWEAPEGHPRRAGVSSFGAGGTKVHVVLEEAPEVGKDKKDCKDTKDNDGGWQLLVLSARTPTALERAAAELADHLESHPGLSLADVAFTLQVGRRAFDHRRVMLCHDLAEAVAGLRSASIHNNELPDEAGLPEAARGLAALGRRWLDGESIDWLQALPAPARRRRVPLPTYPFEKQRYWVEAEGPDIPRFAPPEELRPEPGLPGPGR